MKSWVSRWGTFTWERFHPGVHLPLVALFAMANYYVPLQLDLLPLERGRLLVYFFIVLCFFFRMRVFDEIKDHQVDLKVNPTRPLARGVLSIPEARAMILVLFLFEGLLALSLGQMIFMFYLLPAAYSLLMFEEFFIGKWLSTKLTTYAVSHTFVSALLSALGCVIATHTFGFQDEIFPFFAMNWCFFNLFEFARKSFAPDEERPHVESYSKIFTPRGALLLSISQVALAMYFVSRFHLSPRLVYAGAVIYLALTIPAFIKANSRNFKFFRNSTGLYLLVHYILILIGMGRSM